VNTTQRQSALAHRQSLQFASRVPSLPLGDDPLSLERFGSMRKAVCFPGREMLQNLLVLDRLSHALSVKGPRRVCNLTAPHPSWFGASLCVAHHSCPNGTLFGARINTW